DTVAPDDTDTVPPDDTDTVAPDDTDTVPPDDTDTVAPDDTDTVPPDDTDTVPPVDTGAATDADLDGWTACLDCDDLDGAVHPGQPEVTGDGVDNDCDPATTDLTPTRNFWTFADPWETRDRNDAEVERIYVARRSWVVVYADDHGARGPELFHERVSQLSPSRILLQNPAVWQARQRLHLAVYEDQGVANQFDAADPLLVDDHGAWMERAVDLHFISSTTVESSPYYADNCTIAQYEENRTDLPVDCRCNEATLPICFAPYDSLSVGGAWGAGPRMADVNNVGREVGGGFLDEARREYVVAMNWHDAVYTHSVGVIWGVDVDTGDRRVISGVIDTPSGYVTTGGGYTSNVTISGVVQHTAPLPFLWDVQPGPDGDWYAYGSDAGDNVEIVRIDPATGDRALVWHQAVAGQPHAMGQCASDRPGALSVQFNRRSFTMDPDGNFYLSFHNPGDGDGIVRIPADGSGCEVISRIHATNLPDIGGGYTFQSQDIRGIGWANDVIYAYTVLGDRLIEIDPATGDRTLISSVADNLGAGYASIGQQWLIWDDETGLLWTSGGPSDQFVAVDVTSGDRQSLLRLSSLDTLVPGGHPVDHETRGPLHPGVWSGERFYWHPDNRDHVAMVINGILVGVYEVHTSNSYIFSL
ncbi:MAG TPA: putative metal-binding motif-containing protein, partial [Myxococcota bacterium]|nr:putative metal-binding motif-containing protein [Myxococcota bacterium]